jgi:hypothetical protein
MLTLQSWKDFIGMSAMHMNDNATNHFAFGVIALCIYFFAIFERIIAHGIFEMSTLNTITLSNSLINKMFSFIPEWNRLQD